MPVKRHGWNEYPKIQLDPYMISPKNRLRNRLMLCLQAVNDLQSPSSAYWHTSSYRQSEWQTAPAQRLPDSQPHQTVPRKPRWQRGANAAHCSDGSPL